MDPIEELEAATEELGVRLRALPDDGWDATTDDRLRDLTGRRR